MPQNEHCFPDFLITPRRRTSRIEFKTWNFTIVWKILIHKLHINIDLKTTRSTNKNTKILRNRALFITKDRIRLSFFPTGLFTAIDTLFRLFSPSRVRTYTFCRCFSLFCGLAFYEFVSLAEKRGRFYLWSLKNARFRFNFRPFWPTDRARPKS